MSPWTWTMSRSHVKRAFDHCVEDYARHRPGYPESVFEVLSERAGPPAGRLAGDVGAGTGIFASALAAQGWRVVAVEPSEAMLRGTKRVADQTSADYGRLFPVCATAEATALAARSVALVTAAQAFHWFNPPYALAEVARILEPGGLLALTWNNRDADRSAFVFAFEGLVARYDPTYRREYRQQDWAAKIASAGAFEPARYDCFDHLWRLSADEFIGFTRSVSYIRNTLSAEQRPLFEDDLRQLIHNHFAGDRCQIPLRTDLWTARRK